MSGLHFGVRFFSPDGKNFVDPKTTPKRGRFVGKVLVTGRKIARGSMVSARMRQKFSMPLLFHGFAARMRQKFSMPLLFHGFAAPQALVLDALRTFMATHVETKRCEPILRILWSVLILDERTEVWGDVKRTFGAVEPGMFAYVYRVFSGQYARVWPLGRRLVFTVYWRRF